MFASVTHENGLVLCTKETTVKGHKSAKSVAEEKSRKQRLKLKKNK